MFHPSGTPLTLRSIDEASSKGFVYSNVPDGFVFASQVLQNDTDGTVFDLHIIWFRFVQPLNIY